jgi:hypothetical protein
MCCDLEPGLGDDGSVLLDPDPGLGEHSEPTAEAAEAEEIGTGTLDL